MDLASRLHDSLSDRYRVEREIGAGGMARVFLAEDLKHHRQIALKVFKPELAAALGTERFLAEIKVTARLQHPHLLPLFDSGDAQGLLYYVMPFVEGESLRELLDRERQLSVEEALRITTAVASALDYAHRQGVIHRDLKPENILLHDGEPLIADFGIALALSKAGGTRMTQTGFSLGTPQYMSPEQAAGDRAVDARADIYSLAAVLYEMLTGDPPHTGSTVQAVLAKVLADKPHDIRTLRDTVPEHVEAAVLRALAKTPADRFATVREFAAALHGAWPHTLDSSSRPVTKARGQAPPKSRRRLFTALAVAALALAAAIAIRASGRSADSAVYELTFSDSVIANEALSAPGNVFGVSIALSGDASKLAFVAQSARTGEAMIYVKHKDALEPRPVVAAQAAAAVFSPSGEWIAFVHAGALKKVRIDGSSLVTLSDSGWHSVSWSDRNQLIGSRGEEVWIISADGGRARRIAQPDRQRRHLGYLRPQALPGGKAALITIRKSDPLANEIGVVKLADGMVSPLGLAGSDARYLSSGHILFAGGANAMFAAPFSVRRLRVIGSSSPVLNNVRIKAGGVMQATVADNGTLAYRPTSNQDDRQVVLADAEGATRTLISTPQFYLWPRFSPDGQRLALTISSAPRREIWVFEMPDGPLVRLTSEGVWNDRPEWFPDGRSILFRLSRGNDLDELWTQPADGSGAARLFLRSPPSHVAEGVLSPDGQYVVVQRDFGHGGTLWYRRLSGDTTLRPITMTGSDIEPRFSPDGKWLAYSSSGSGTSQVYVRPFPTLDARYQLSLDQGFMPVWSRTGTRLYYVVGRRIVVADIAASPEFRVTARHVLPEEYAFSGPHADFDVAPDGRSIVAFRSVGSQARLIVIERFEAKVKAALQQANRR